MNHLCTNLSIIGCYYIVIAFVAINCLPASLEESPSVYRYIFDAISNANKGSEQADQQQDVRIYHQEMGDFSRGQEEAKSRSDFEGISMNRADIAKDDTYIARKFLVLVLFWRKNTDKVSMCHGTILSDKLILIPSLCLGNLKKYPIRKIYAMNATFYPELGSRKITPNATDELDELDEFDQEEFTKYVAHLDPNYKPKFEPLSSAQKLCITGENAETPQGHLSLIKLMKPLASNSFFPLQLPKDKLPPLTRQDDKGKPFNGPGIYSLNTTSPHPAYVTASACPNRITDKTVACFMKDDRWNNFVSSQWSHVNGICNFNIGAPIIGGGDKQKGPFILYGILGRPNKLCYDRYIYAADIQKLSAQIDRLIKICS